MTNEEIARICHEVNRGLCEALGDYSQTPWETAPEWQRESALEGVKNALAGAEPHESHERWCKQKVTDGWVWGALKMPDMKTHPCLVGFDELPVTQQLKDHLFVTVVRVLGLTGKGCGP